MRLITEIIRPELLTFDSLTTDNTPFQAEEQECIVPLMKRALSLSRAPSLKLPHMCSIFVE